MTEPTTVIVDDRAGILTLTLNRPEAVNALNPELVEALITRLSSAENTRLCVIRGEGKHFCAGFDLSDIDDLRDGDLLWRFLRIECLLQLVHHAPFPVMAMAHGQVVGAGADLFAASTRRVASADARFRFPGWNFELALGTRRLSRLIGTDAARDLLIDTKVVPAETAVTLGLATDLYETGDWDCLVGQMAKRAETLPGTALADLLDLTAPDTRNDDIAAIVRTAGRPGLKDRIVAWRQHVADRRSK